MTDFIDPLDRISRAIRNTAYDLNDDEARALVDAYYQTQQMRLTTANQIRVIRSGDDDSVQIPFLDWMLKSYQQIEATIKTGLQRYASQRPAGAWSLEIPGIGPVLAAGLLAHLSGRERSSAGQIWSFAGLNPEAEWGKGQKRPWNAELKVLCWKLGESFVKVQNHERDIYGKLYVERRLYEWRKNLAGDYADQARSRIDHPNWERAGRNLESKKWWRGCYALPQGVTAEDLIQGNQLGLMEEVNEGAGLFLLPPIAIHERSKRVAVKMFLSHYFEAMYFLDHGKLAPLPYVISQLGHIDYIAPPHPELIPGWKEAYLAAGIG